MRHRPNYRHRRPLQKSPFFRLPAEIRNHIYRHALVSPSPIDLCPADYVYEESSIDAHSALLQRRLAYENSPGFDPRWRETAFVKLAFRMQSDLQYLRKRLAVHLLAVCYQIYSEAALYFWGENVWRFSDDKGWEMLWRFLLTIGSRARSLIQNIEVLALSACSSQSALPWEVMNWNFKNHPKLHMTKIWSDQECYERVLELWMSERSLHKLKLIIPAGYDLGGYSSYFDYWNSDEVSMQVLARLQLVIEDGGTLFDPVDHIQKGWDVVMLPGSYTVEIKPGLPLASTRQESLQVWEFDLDCLTGVMQLFQNEETSVHANDGKARTMNDQKRVKRVLNGFGPCMIKVEELGPCICPRCTGAWFFQSTVHRWETVRYTSLMDLEEN